MGIYWPSALYPTLCLSIVPHVSHNINPSDARMIFKTDLWSRGCAGNGAGNFVEI
jgi:hypothetical protein